MLLRVRWVQTDRLPSGWILRALFTMSIIPCHISGRVGSSLEEPTPQLLLMDIFTMQLWVRWVQSGRLASWLDSGHSEATPECAGLCSGLWRACHLL